MDRAELEQKSTQELKTLREHHEDIAENYNSQQMALKIILNSLYGALGSQFFRYSDTNQALAITLSGQASIQWASKAVNRYLNKTLGTDNVDYVAGIDTDSLYINLTPFVEAVMGEDAARGRLEDDTAVIEFMDRLSEEKIQKVIADAYAEFAEKTNAYENKMDMKREKLGSGIFVQKKRYAFKTYDNEGVRYAEPKISITGLEAVRSTTPEFCREHIKRLLRLCFESTEAEMIREIEAIRKDFESLDAFQIAMPTGANDMEKYATDGAFLPRTPFHIKGAIMYNRMVKENGLEGEYQLIRSGDKVRLIHLKAQNPFGGVEGFAFPDTLPPEFGVEKYIDFEAQFEKTFLKPLRRVLDVIGWKTHHVNTLSGFMKKRGQ